jgi:hypothetical protein
MIPASVHAHTGMAVLTATLLAMVIVGFLAWRGRELSRTARAVMIVAQLAVMVLVLIGIKLLDQGAGPLQLYIHYVGGLAPLALFLVASWWPARDPRIQSRIMAFITAGAFVFALLTFTIGQAYARGVFS